jgi:anhydro-N-acetylmuramic acid kinase
MNGSSRLIAGVMSGTSADGVDVAITRISGRGQEMTAELVIHVHRPYPVELGEAVFKLRARGQARLRELAEMGRAISLSYSGAVLEALGGAKLQPSDLAAVAAHGQTLFHSPPTTVQWLDPSLVAWQVGCPVVSDFRRADCAAGGQGAPLVPFADYILFKDTRENRVVLNIGGIANLTLLRAGGSLGEVIAFDTGPGNCISDWICRNWGKPGQHYDAGGVAAAQGTVLQSIANRFLSSPYFAAPAPKSTDGPAMIELFKRPLGEMPILPAFNDLLATATYLTATTISQAMASLKVEVRHVIASGGGIRNGSIMDWLRAMQGTYVRIDETDAHGVPSAAKEAMAFALLAAATLDGEPSNIPSVTGARRPVILGSITPRP